MHVLLLFERMNDDDDDNNNNTVPSKYTVPGKMRYCILVDDSVVSWSILCNVH